MLKKQSSSTNYDNCVRNFGIEHSFNDICSWWLWRLQLLVLCFQCYLKVQNVHFSNRFLINYYVLLISFLLPSYAWVLQDILGICFCISLIKNIRLPNLKVCTILLLLLLIYDIFFVFITPLFSAGKSVMVQVATGKNFHYLTSILLICIVSLRKLVYKSFWF